MTSQNNHQRSSIASLNDEKTVPISNRMSSNNKNSSNSTAKLSGRKSVVDLSSSSNEDIAWKKLSKIWKKLSKIQKQQLLAYGEQVWGSEGDDDISSITVSCKVDPKVEIPERKISQKDSKSTGFSVKETDGNAQYPLDLSVTNTQRPSDANVTNTQRPSDVIFANSYDGVVSENTNSAIGGDKVDRKAEIPNRKVSEQASESSDDLVTNTDGNTQRQLDVDVTNADNGVVKDVVCFQGDKLVNSPQRKIGMDD